MVKMVEKLTAESPPDAVLRLGKDALAPDIQGWQTGELLYIERKTGHESGKRYDSFCCRIAQGPGAGERVFGRAFPGRDLNSLARAISLSLGGECDVPKEKIGATVRFEVGMEERRDLDGNTEPEPVIIRIHPPKGTIS